MGLPLAENGIFPSFNAPEVGVTPNISVLRVGLTARTSRSILWHPPGTVKFIFQQPNLVLLIHAMSILFSNFLYVAVPIVQQNYN